MSHACFPNAMTEILRRTDIYELKASYEWPLQLRRWPDLEFGYAKNACRRNGHN